MIKIKKNIEYIFFCKYSKFMSNKLNFFNGKKRTQQNSQFLEHGVYVREDDQDWGSAGMNNIEEEEAYPNQ